MDTKNNNLIAEFMGYINTTPTDKDFNIYQHPQNKKMIETMSMQYHTSWDWLMPVIEKISNYKYEDFDTAYPRTFGMIGEKGIPMFRFNRHHLFQEKTLIESAHMACIEFIKWYNQNK